MSHLAILAARTVYLDRSNQQRAAGRCAAVQHPSMTDDPCRMGDADDAGLVDDAEIAAVEAVAAIPATELAPGCRPQLAESRALRKAMGVVVAMQTPKSWTAWCGVLRVMGMMRCLWVA